MTVRTAYDPNRRGHFKGILNLGFDGTTFYEQDVDVDGRISSRNYIWNASSLQWEAATGSLAGGASVEVSNFPATQTVDGNVGLLTSADVRINPAKEDGNLATIAGKDFATQTTLAAVNTKLSDGNQKTQIVDASGNSVNLDADTITPTYNADDTVATIVWSKSGVTQQTATFSYSGGQWTGTVFS